MRISRNWLSEYITIPFPPAELAERLTMLGLEIEAIEDLASKFDRIVVGEVLEVTPHPNADKLRLTRVAVGNGEPLRIVCGAPNVRQGLKVAVATIGADLGEGFVIRKSKIRGEVSEGMLCSKRELGISDEHEGIWELPVSVSTGAPLASALGKDDVIFEIGITPNRPDCLSHFGIAREIHALTGQPLRTPDVRESKIGGAVAEQVKVTIEAPELCPRYVAKVVRGVKVGSSPDWLVARLEAVGLRSINNVVDVTNFVLMECGHPLHAFDLSAVKDQHVVVRTAAGFATEYTTLDSKVRTLPETALLIADPEKPLGIAGVMGGENSEIRETTTDVLIESAYFLPSSIRRTAKQLGLSTDASYRFERGTDINVLPYAAERAAQLIAEVAGGSIVEGMIDEYPNPQTAKTFGFRPSRASAMLGRPIAESTMQQIFERLFVGVTEETPDRWLLTSPSFRVDLEREEDAIEEIARVTGYDEIPISTFEPTPLTGAREPLRPRDFEDLLRSALLSIGVTECVSTPLVSAEDASHFHTKAVELINPLNLEKNRMRTSVGVTLLEAARHNERFGVEGLRLFELGNVFNYATETRLLGQVVERPELGVLLSGVQQAKTPYSSQVQKADIFYLKSVVELVLGRLGLRDYRYTPVSAAVGTWQDPSGIFDVIESLGVVVGETPVAVLGKVSPLIQKAFDLRSEAYLVLFEQSALYELARAVRLAPTAVKPLPKYPSVERDLALVLRQDIPAGAVLEVIQRTAPADLLRKLTVFDEFQSPEMKAAGERSLAFHLVFRAEERTLEEAEVDRLIELILKQLGSELHARLRA